MAVSALLVPVSTLQTLLRITVNPSEAYAELMVSQASNAVRDAGVLAKIPGAAGWVALSNGSEPGTGQVEAPDVARDVTLWVASRAYVNPQNLSRKTSGPISDTFRDSGVYGVELTADEKARIAAISGVSTTGGLWVQPIAYGVTAEPLTVPSELTPPGDPFTIADSDDFPYADPVTP